MPLLVDSDACDHRAVRVAGVDRRFERQLTPARECILLLLQGQQDVRSEFLPTYIPLTPSGKLRCTHVRIQKESGAGSRRAALRPGHLLRRAVTLCTTMRGATDEHAACPSCDVSIRLNTIYTTMRGATDEHAAYPSCDVSIRLNKISSCSVSTSWSECLHRMR